MEREYIKVFAVGAGLFAMAALVSYLYLNHINIRNLKTVRIGDMFGKPASVLLGAAMTVAGGLLAILCDMSVGIGAKLIFDMIFLAILAAVAVIDWKSMEIPDALPICAGVLGIISVAVTRDPGWISAIIGIFAVSVPLLIITFFSDGAFGGGDIKLMAGCGLFLGWKLCLLSAFIGIILGGIWGLFLMAVKKRDKKSHFAFGPCLCAGMALCCLYGSQIMALYFKVFDISSWF